MTKKTTHRIDRTDPLPETKRLRLRRETLRVLTSTELTLVNGGVTTAPGNGGGGNDSRNEEVAC